MKQNDIEPSISGITHSAKDFVMITARVLIIFTFSLACSRCQSSPSSKQFTEDFRFLKAMYDDVHRAHPGPSLSGFPLADEKCYAEIGCFSPSTGIVTDFNLHVDSPRVIDTKFLLYTKLNHSAPIRLDYIDKSTVETIGFNPELEVIFIVHGMNENGHVKWIMDLKDAILQKKDANVITVDWGKGCPLPYYGQGIVNAEVVSRQVARLLIAMKQKRSYNIRKTHMIGYSLGAHLSGFTAKYLKQEGEYIGRITGLDPASPNFEKKDERFHLSYQDADYVDVVHTSAGDSILTGNVGMVKPIGHVDFYPNGGKDQPGCGFFELVCSHRRAVLLYVESIRSNCVFESFGCNSYSEFNAGQCSDRKANLGYYSNQATISSGSFYLNTTGHAPYCAQNEYFV